MLSNDKSRILSRTCCVWSRFLRLLSLDKAARRLNAVNTVKNYNNNDTDRLDRSCYIYTKIIKNRITLSEVAKLTNMSDASLTRVS